MDKLQQRILFLIYGDGVSYRTEELVSKTNATREEVLSACSSLEMRGYIFNQGDDLWDKDDEDYTEIWQVTKDGCLQVEAMR